MDGRPEMHVRDDRARVEMLEITTDLGLAGGGQCEQQQDIDHVAMLPGDAVPSYLLESGP